jgi:hypothetical protein
MYLIKLAKYCNAIYNKNNINNTIIEYNSQGFKSCVIKDDENKTFIIVIRGTDNIQGIINDIEMILHMPPHFNKYATTVYETTLEYNNQYNLNYNIIVTGHSLGGSLGQYLTNKYGISSYNFNPYGIIQSLNAVCCNNEKLSNNYMIWDDVVASINTSHQYGINYIFKTTDVKCINVIDKYLHIHSMNNIIKLLESGVEPCKI